MGRAIVERPTTAKDWVDQRKLGGRNRTVGDWGRRPRRNPPPCQGEGRGFESRLPLSRIVSLADLRILVGSACSQDDHPSAMRGRAETTDPEGLLEVVPARTDKNPRARGAVAPAPPKARPNAGSSSNCFRSTPGPDRSRPSPSPAELGDRRNYVAMVCRCS
jgi:hypothetical protein